ncbi:hypothetical protein [Nonomuraea cavernae]|uniref:hypothetical protein n=1 Tax=Nonomuraea cavernae TaxID=2045107 RepID=UPI0033C9DD85
MRRVALLLTVPLLALATACGSAQPAGGDAVGAPTTSAANDSYLKYAKCLREHGVKNFPDDPKQLPAGGTQIPEEAGKACEKEMQGVAKTIDGKDPAYLDRMTRLAKCMRGHGIDFPDPGPDGKMPGPDFNGGDQTKFDAAMKECSAEAGGQ